MAEKNDDLLHNVYLLISEGNIVRDLLRLGMLDIFLDMQPDCRVIILTPAYAVPEFRAEFLRDRVMIERHLRWEPSSLLLSMRIRLRKKMRKRLLVRLLWKTETQFARVAPELQHLFDLYPPALVVSTHPFRLWEWDVIAYADKCGFATAAVVKSWDNVIKGLTARTRYIAVWNEVNRREAIELQAYRDDEITTVGAAAFDRYFDPAVIQPRDAFWRSKGLDPDRPIVLFGTSGGSLSPYDETFMMDLLLHLADQVPELQKIQYVCRLHPSSDLLAFWPYQSHPRVVLSFSSYIKTLGWTMTVEQVDEMANMLCHADVLITPASTLTLESAIFDTPTIVPAFSTVQPDQVEKAMEASRFGRHFQPLVQNNWVPIVHSEQALAKAMIRALRDPAWYRDGRKAIVENYVPFRDRRSGQRVAQFIADMVTRSIEKQNLPVLPT